MTDHTPPAEVDADTVASRAAQVISSMGAEIRALRRERNRYRNAWQSARERAQAYGEGILRVVKDRESYQEWLRQAEERAAAVLPPPVSRADVYRDAADALERKFEGATRATIELRRMADEAQPSTDRLLPDGTVDYDAPPPPATDPGVPLRTAAILDRAAAEAWDVPDARPGTTDHTLTQRHQDHAEGEHAFCGDECEAPK